MPKYEVTGEYGPVAGMSISLEVEEPTAPRAFDTFCMLMEADYPSEWARMGRRNVAVIREIKPKVEEKIAPKAVEVTQTMWRVKFRSRSDMIVTAATLLDVADHVRGWCVDNRFPVSDVTRIEYLAY